MNKQITAKYDRDCAILIASCDSYRDVWPIFFHFFFKHWPDCPFPIYLISNQEVYSDSRVKTLALHHDLSWSHDMKEVLDLIPERYFVLFLEDFLLTKDVDTVRISKFLELAKDNCVSCLRLFPHPPADLTWKVGSELGLIAKDAPYRSSTQTAIWDKEAFVRLLVLGENAWQFELEGTRRAQMMDEIFLSTWKGDYAVSYFGAIKRGEWFYDAIKMCRKEGISIDPKRKIEKPFDAWTRKLTYWPIIGRPVRIFRRNYFLMRKKLSIYR